MRALTARQHQVLLLVARGHTNAQIAVRLQITAGTVNEVLGNAYRTLGARDRANAVALAIWHGHLTPADLATITHDQRRQETAA